MELHAYDPSAPKDEEIYEFQVSKALFKKKKSNLHILYFLWLGSVINQVFHPVVFDKCIQILKKSWPQESNLSQKRKKEHPRSSKNNHRRGRKRGKPPRKEDDQVRRHFQAGLGGDRLALFTWWVQDCQDCIQTVNAHTQRRDCSMQSSADHSGLGNLEQHRDLGKVRSSMSPVTTGIDFMWANETMGQACETSQALVHFLWSRWMNFQERKKRRKRRFIFLPGTSLIYEMPYLIF